MRHWTPTRCITGLARLGWRRLRCTAPPAIASSTSSAPTSGRQLDGASIARLQALDETSCDVGLVIADGLSATATARHALPLIEALLPRLEGQRLGTVAVAIEARVAIGDPIGEQLGAELVLVLIGERPGLSATDSLGAYLTWQPRSGRSDAERNCVSNIRPDGLSIADASRRIACLMAGARQLGATGVALKDNSEEINACRQQPKDQGRRSASGLR